MYSKDNKLKNTLELLRTEQHAALNILSVRVLDIIKPGASDDEISYLRTVLRTLYSQGYLDGMGEGIGEIWPTKL